MESGGTRNQPNARSAPSRPPQDNPTSVRDCSMINPAGLNSMTRRLALLLTEQSRIFYERLENSWLLFTYLTARVNSNLAKLSLAVAVRNVTNI